MHVCREHSETELQSFHLDRCAAHRNALLLQKATDQSLRLKKLDAKKRSWTNSRVVSILVLHSQGISTHTLAISVLAKYRGLQSHLVLL